MIAGSAYQGLQVAVNFNDFPAPRLSVQTIDVLRENHHPIQRLFKAGNRPVCGVWLCTATVLFDLDQILPGNVGPDRKNLSGKRFFNGKPFIRQIPLI